MTLEGILFVALASMAEPASLPEPVMRWKLPKALREVSGLARGPGGMVWAHDDERGLVYLLDVSNRRVRRRLEMRDGSRVLRGDFEGIAAASGALWLMTSDATLYRADGPVSIERTGLGSECEFEGLTVRAGLLVLACKRVFDGGADARLILWNPARRSEVGRIDFSRRGPLHVSGIDWCDTPPRFVGVAARERLLFTVDELGRIEALYALDKHLHPQPEGILVAPGELLIADEGSERGHLTRYQVPLCR